ncbi:radical SAM protein [Methanolobus chelungpuianus]|uniref:radical SAM protein n=1 Tax=Methanolobus chelungpuianus TaxID=502115 RepID=UPI002114FA0A|nr:radical SAM protein [Methanolobus chelungpuianus]
MYQKNILLVEPDFPIPTKSKNHKNFLPIGLLKLASYYRNQNFEVDLIRGKKLSDKFITPSLIEITSLFTYWSDYVWDAVKFYREHFPDPDVTEIRVGGIYASLHFENQDFRYKCKKYHVTPVKGVQEEVENFFPAYDIVKNSDNHVDYQIIHSSRGCFRKCSFCGTWKIEPEFKGKKEITSTIESGLQMGLKNLVFYDNNLFYNPFIESILKELAILRKERKIGWCESQSGFDGRVLLQKPHLVPLLKKAGFRYPRIAWDWGYDQWPEIEKQIRILVDSGYNPKNITVFMIYNWKLDFEEMEQKRIKCWEWKVQISDCRNRPLEQLHDHYKPLKDQNHGNDYYINPNWTDAEIKQFRQNVRRQNICSRQNLAFHSKLLEHKKHFTKEHYNRLKLVSFGRAAKFLPDLWIPSKVTHPQNRDKWSVKPVEPPKNLAELLDADQEMRDIWNEFVEQTPVKEEQIVCLEN